MTRLSNSVVSLFTPQAAVKPQRKILSVGELVLDVKRNIETNFRDVAVVGEVSSFKPWRSGHWYFDLKDEQALVPAVMFKQHCGRVRFDVKDGMQVLVTGRVSVYPSQSKVQILVETMEPVGVGALALAFEQLKKKLEHEGLFAEGPKKKLPTHPRVVGLVTSPQGAALRDMLRILQQRMPNIRVVISPARVQGQGAAMEICTALQRLDVDGACDVIIIGRGGGSLEDLWAFNEELVARAIFNCQTPIVSAVGHETDFTIADFVADMRCATPTHAAQTVVPDIGEVRNGIVLRGNRLHRQIKTLLARHHLVLERASKRLKEPRVLIFQHMQRLDEWSMRSRRAMTQALNRNKARLKLSSSRLGYLAPHVLVTQKRKRFDELSQRLQQGLKNKVQESREQSRILAARLLALSPLSVLARGYALVYRPENNGESKGIVAKIADVKVHDRLSVRVSDGYIDVTVDAISASELEGSHE